MAVSWLLLLPGLEEGRAGLRVGESAQGAAQEPRASGSHCRPACSSQQRRERLVQVSCSHGGGFNPQDPMAWGPGELDEQATLSPVWPEQRAGGCGKSRVGWRAGGASGGFGALDRAGGRPSERQRNGLCLRVLVWGVETGAAAPSRAWGQELGSPPPECQEGGGAAGSTACGARGWGGGRGRAWEAGVALGLQAALLPPGHPPEGSAGSPLGHTQSPRSREAALSGILANGPTCQGQMFLLPPPWAQACPRGSVRYVTAPSPGHPAQ